MDEPRRSIPVRTGEPKSAWSAVKRRAVYPRAYGGTGLAGGLIGATSGLSPCVRGNQLADRLVAVLRRSIPVRTGEPRPTPIWRGATAVYPRAYGGTELHPTWQGRMEGLSPCVRGNPLVRQSGH